MNYTTQCIEELNLLVSGMSDRIYFEDRLNLIQLKGVLEKSVKFLLPHDGNVGISEVNQDIFNLVRLPYKSVVFEYSASPTTVEGNISSTKRIALLIEKEVDGKKGIHAHSIFEYSGKWVVVPVSVFVPYESEIVLGEDKIPRIEAITEVFLPGSFYMTAKSANVSNYEMMGQLVKDCQEELFVSLKALACLNARNVHEVCIPAPENLNKKRMKNKKVPFFEYRTLNIFLGEHAVSVRPKDRANLAQKMFRSRAKLHSVRGHFKKRKTGIYWWSAFIRGSSSKGEVVKDYRLK